MKDVSLSVGYSLMRGTSTMDVVKGGNHKSWQDWGWVSLNVNPTLFKNNSYVRNKKGQGLFHIEGAVLVLYIMPFMAFRFSSM